MSKPALLAADDSALLVVDMQSGLAAAMDPAAWTRTRDTACLLARGAHELGLPVIVTRQYPRGLGDVDEHVSAAMPDWAVVLDKTRFSAAEADDIRDALRMTGRRQIVVCGMEAHVCILQTVAGLAGQGHVPFVVDDGICSRTRHHADNARDRMRAAGIELVNRESVLFEWLRDARHDRFKAISALLK